MGKSFQEIANDLAQRDDWDHSTSIDPMKRRKGPYIFVCLASLLISVFFVIAFNYDWIHVRLDPKKPLKTSPKPQGVDERDEIFIVGGGIGSIWSASGKRVQERQRRFLIDPPMDSFPLSGGDLAELRITKVGKYRIAYRQYIDVDRSSYSKSFVRFRTHVTRAQFSFEPVRIDEKSKIGPEGFVRVMGAQGDFPNMFFDRDDMVLMNKLHRLYRGDGIHVFGRVHLTESGFFVVVHDFVKE
ncbi:MAG: hypothetical protein ACYTFG_04255 [Planctomycetota bacterium]